MDSSKRTVAVIPAAGKSERFVAAGYQGPKASLLILNDGGIATMISHVLAALPRSWVPIIGTTGDLVPTFQKILGDWDDVVSVVDVGAWTSGQADTIHRILQWNTDQDNEVVVVNSDNVFWRRDLEILHAYLAIADCTMLVHRSINVQCSYVDQVPLPTRFAEKDPISEWAMSGAWAFSSSRKLQQALHESMHIDAQVRGEWYLSAALARYSGRKIAIPTENVLDWGTPESLTATGARIIR